MSHSIKIIFAFILICQFINTQAQTKKLEFMIDTPENFQLSGEIEYPSKGKKFPAAILIWGNGPHTREQEISKSPTFKHWAEFLLNKGFAVLRMDKRGFGKSTGKFKAEDNYTTLDLADDVRLSYAFLKKQSFIDSTKIGMIGHSEGAIIASILAASDSSVSWVIMYGAPGVPGDSIIAAQTRQNRLQLGMSVGRTDSVGKVWQEYLHYLKEGNTDDAKYYSIGRKFLIAHGLAEDDKRITNEFIDQLLSGYKSKWTHYFINTEPVKFYRQIRCPVLVVFGSEDKQVPVAQNFLPIYRSLSSMKNFRMVVLADEDHFFLRYGDQRLTKHIPGEMKLSNRLLELCGEWFQSVFIISR